MSFSNEFLYDFKPVYEGILMAKDVKPERAVVEVIAEAQEGAGMFEPAGALEVLEQIGDDVTRLQFIRTGLHILGNLQRQCMRRMDWFRLSYQKSALDWQKKRWDAAVFSCLILSGMEPFMKNRLRWENIISPSIKEPGGQLKILT